MDTKRISYVTVRTRNNSLGVFTFIIENIENDKMKFQWSFCNPKDQFSRKTGKSFASDREPIIINTTEKPSETICKLYNNKSFPIPTCVYKNGFLENDGRSIMWFEGDQKEYDLIETECAEKLNKLFEKAQDINF